MKSMTTNRLLTLGMALYADKRCMEQRVRGIFGRARTAGFARALALLLCLVVFAGCFTTACMPVRESTAGVKAPSAQLDETVGTPSVTQVPEADASAIAAPAAVQPPVDPIGEFIKNLRPAAFMPLTVPSRVIRNPVLISDGVMLTYDASVTVPEASAYAVEHASPEHFSEAEIAELEELFNVPEIIGEGRYSTDARAFYYCRYNAGITRKTWAQYEMDWSPEEMALFDDPVPLTRAETQPIAEKALADMGVSGYVLDMADEAIAIGNDAEGKPYAVSKGWEYVFVPQSNGLPQHYYGGFFGGPKDPVFYHSAHMERLWLYIDEQGVSRIDWIRSLRVDETIAENVALISLDEVIALADERFTRLYTRDDANVDIRVQNIRLAAMLLANSSDATEAYCAPVWELEYSVTFGGLHRELCVLPFNAVDGGAVFAIGFPW